MLKPSYNPIEVNLSVTHFYAKGEAAAGRGYVAGGAFIDFASVSNV